ncbi:MAG: transposase [Phycisphaerae bacterium]|nr:transposase [Phycisphaerae bacterium]
MPRAPRADEGGLIYHVLNRGNARAEIFFDADDYELFEAILAEGLQRTPLRILCYCLMPNHWHLVLWPREDGDLSSFMYWVGMTHTQRWHAKFETTGSGHLYQGRYKSFPVQTDEHFLTVCRYVERNPLRAKLVRKAENWRWSSLYKRLQDQHTLLTPWPVEAPRNWVERVNAAETAAELERMRRSVNRNRPYGSPAWQARTAKRLGLESTIRPSGRPKKKSEKGSCPLFPLFPFSFSVFLFSAFSVLFCFLFCLFCLWRARWWSTTPPAPRSSAASRT